MKKIGFIDYYLDNFHANNYPDMIKEKSGGTMEVAYAYGCNEPKDKLTSRQWADKYGVELLDTIEEVVDKSDYLIVLSPNNPEMHYELSELALKSGKLTYIDKTFATDKKEAERIFALAEANNTPCYSSSALKFSSELAEFPRDNIETVVSQGPGPFEMYSIHQIEPIINLMNADAKRVMCINGGQYPGLVIEFTDGRLAQMNQIGWETPFSLDVGYTDGKAQRLEITSDYFELFIEGLVDFFKAGIPKVSHRNTINVIAVRSAGIKALETPFVWVDID